MAIHSRLRFLDPPSHIWQRSQKFQMHIIESGEVVKPLATLATLTNLPWNDAHNWKWRGCQNSDNLGTSDNLVTKGCTLYLLLTLSLSKNTACSPITLSCRSRSDSGTIASSTWWSSWRASRGRTKWGTGCNWISTSWSGRSSSAPTRSRSIWFSSATRPRYPW